MSIPYFYNGQVASLAHCKTFLLEIERWQPTVGQSNKIRQSLVEIEPGSAH